ncbi:MAG: tRNA (guanine-N1)-methyltransferase [Crenarchaeota archaeon]|nr:tRNA (guanine-N1)-methyltransferase [Thermoproteota archaeon]
MSTELIEVTEGNTRVLVPNLERYRIGRKIEPAHAPVFYNPAMEVNRSISVLAVEAYSRLFNYKDLTVCEPLSGTGIRGLRYLLETKCVSKVIMNDIDEDAYKLILMNVEKNNVQNRVEVYNTDASQLLLNLRGRIIDIVDVDPFGSPIEFIYPALKAIRHRGLLAVTATDVGVLMGRYPQKCIRRYGSRPIYSIDYSREIGLRILVGSIARIALQLDYGIRPLLCYYEGHYYRCFMMILKDRSDAVLTVKNLGYVLHVRASGKIEFLKKYPTYKIRRRDVDVGGPLWIGHIIDLDFVKEIYEILISEKQYLMSNEKLVKLIEEFIEEAPLSNVPYYTTSMICRGLGSEVSSRRLIEALRKAGIDASRTHMDPRGVRALEEVEVLREIASSILDRE